MRPRTNILGNRWHCRLPFYLRVALLAGLLCCHSNSRAAAQDAIDGLDSKPDLHEIIVSHTDENNTLQLYFTKEDGSSKRQITDGKHNCIQPAWSPDGKKVVYVQQSEKGMALWLTDPQGKGSKALTESGNNLLPSWLPDSKHIVWMLTKGGKDPSRNSQGRKARMVVMTPKITGLATICAPAMTESIPPPPVLWASV